MKKLLSILILMLALALPGYSQIPPPPAAVPDPLPEIEKIEYFFDTDPGFGNGNDVPIIADSIVDKNFNIDISGLDVGRHLVYFRSRDENGRWTLNHVEHINKAAPSPASASDLPDIVAIEYFYNSDPGFGNGISVPVADDSITDEDFNLDMSSLDLGRHLVYFRTRDENGRWTLTHVEQVDKLVPASESAVPLPDIVAMEYFFDTDPGFGNGTPIEMTADSLVDIDFSLDVSAWGAGMHILYIRSLDELGRWSLVYLTPVTGGEISRRMRHGKFFYDGIEQPMFTEDPPD